MQEANFVGPAAAVRLSSALNQAAIFNKPGEFECQPVKSGSRKGKRVSVCRGVCVRVCVRYVCVRVCVHVYTESLLRILTCACSTCILQIKPMLSGHSALCSRMQLH